MRRIAAAITLLGLVLVILGPGATPALAQDAGGTYTVQPGDTLAQIARRFNTTIDELLRLNNLTNPNVIYVGQALRIPGGPLPALPVVPAPPATVGEAGPITNQARNVGFTVGIEAALTAQNGTQIAGRVNDLGLGWIRVSIDWKAYEPAPGAIAFDALDALIDPLHAANLNIMLTVGRAPDWARSTAELDGPPDDAGTFGAFVGALAGRYQGRVQAYEIWAQPNIRREWAGQPLGAAGYVELLRAAFNAIKQADPTAIVVSAGLAPTGVNDGVNAINDREFLRQAYAAGLAAYTDAIGVQPGGWANPPDSTCCAASPGVSGWFNDRSFYFRDTLADYRQIMTENNDGGTFIWVTAFGWGSSEGVVPDISLVNRDYGFVNFTDQVEQAQYIVRGIEIGRALGYIGPMFLTSLNGCQITADPAAPGFESCYFSLLDPAGNPRPAYGALRAARK